MYELFEQAVRNLALRFIKILFIQIKSLNQRLHDERQTNYEKTLRIVVDFAVAKNAWRKEREKYEKK